MWLLGLMLAVSAPSDTLRFVVDMRPAVEAGWFDPAQEAVGVRGEPSPLSWAASQIATDRDGDLRYEVAVALPADSFVVAYKFKVEGTNNPDDGWESGPNRRVAWGGVGQTVERAFGSLPEGSLGPPRYAGTVRTHPQFAAAPLEDRTLYVYLPPGYDADTTRRYPVLYLHDGQHVFDPRSSPGGQEWEMDEAAQRLIAAGEMPPAILVGVASTGARMDEYTPVPMSWSSALVRTAPAAGTGLARFEGTYRGETGATQFRRSAAGATLDVQSPDGQWFTLTPAEAGVFTLPGLGFTFAFNAAADTVRVVEPPRGGQADAYGRFLVAAVKPFIDATYRTLPDAAHTALGGSSLGGLVTLYLGLRHPDVFGSLLVVSPSVWWADRWILGFVAQQPFTAQRIWVDMGTAEGYTALPDARLLRDALRAKGWQDGPAFAYTEAPGAAHNEAAWARRAPAMLRFLYRQP